MFHGDLYTLYNGKTTLYTVLSEVFTFNDFSEEPWSIRSDHKTGELAYLGTFDPLGPPRQQATGGVSPYSRRRLASKTHLGRVAMFFKLLLSELKIATVEGSKSAIGVAWVWQLLRSCCGRLFLN